ncbi:MAG: HpcH/HpaI aldolase/citrate lyase family protein [Phyllobacterium sp.]
MKSVRSLLFAPGDSERKIVKALGCATDAVILDLEDSVRPEQRAAARGLCYETLSGYTGDKKLFVRINALDTPDALPDLAAVVRGRPYGVMLPKCQSASDLGQLDHHLSALEARDNLPVGTISVLPIVTETGRAMFNLGTYGEGTPRLTGLLWGGEDLAADIGAHTNRDANKKYTPIYELARTLCLLAATASRSTAVDAVYTDFRNSDALRAEAEAAARDGFTAKAAIHPDQIDIINEVFTPTTEQADYARRIVAAFQDNGKTTSVAALEGRMLDRPHLIMAQRLLGRLGQE